MKERGPTQTGDRETQMTHWDKRNSSRFFVSSSSFAKWKIYFLGEKCIFRTENVTADAKAQLFFPLVNVTDPVCTKDRTNPTRTPAFILMEILFRPKIVSVKTLLERMSNRNWVWNCSLLSPCLDSSERSWTLNCRVIISPSPLSLHQAETQKTFFFLSWSRKKRRISQLFSSIISTRKPKSEPRLFVLRWHGKTFFLRIKR